MTPLAIAIIGAAAFEVFAGPKTAGIDGASKFHLASQMPFE